jgi:hypothetical protein
MTDHESNIQAYRLMAEVLVNMRRIMVRGLHKASGKSWYEEGCPPEVYRRLSERRESESAMERTVVETEDLMAFATFGDMAEIVDQNDALAQLLHRLAPSRQFLSARMSELESLSGKLVSARPLTEEEFRMLTNYHMKLRDLVAGARGRPHPERAEAVDDSLSAGEIESSSKEVVAPLREPPPEVSPIRPPSDSTPPPDDTVAEPRSDGEHGTIDDTETLQTLRHEIVAAADSLFKHDEQVDIGEWRKAKKSGWFKKRSKELDLEPVGAFYETVEEHQKLAAAGATPGELDGFLTRTGLARVLLELRELFLRLGV